MKYVYLGAKSTCIRCSRHWCLCKERWDGTWESNLPVKDFNSDPEEKKPVLQVDKTLKVSDWSQKYKLVIYALSGTVLIILGFKVVGLLNEIIRLLGIIAKK